MHNSMPAKAASARMRLDEAALDLISAQRQVRHGEAAVKEELLSVIEQALLHTRNAIDVLI